MSTAIEGADVRSRWRDDGEACGGDIDVNLNGEFGVIFADSSEFQGLAHSPAGAASDRQGQRYLCLAEPLRDPNNARAEARFRIDESELSALHEG